MRDDLGELTESADHDPLTAFCRDHLLSLTRRDQRRWGETYVRGLATLPGRKSIRSISAEIAGGRAEQCLQQFVNQSPWPWEPVRRSLACSLTTALRPTAWVVREVAFAKNGDRSVGVARQYVNSLGRTVNCQLGLALFVLGERGSCPVNWRLLLPPCWDEETRRAGARLPARERPVPRWRSLLSVVDELVQEWRMAPVPLVMDMRREPELTPLLQALDERQLPYQLQVNPDHHDRAGAPASGRPLRQWPAGHRTPRATWITNAGQAHPGDVAQLLGTQRRVGLDLARLADGAGLKDFEGRSYQGWHHHVTLVSVAYAYRLLHGPATPITPVGRTLLPA